MRLTLIFVGLLFSVSSLARIGDIKPVDYLDEMDVVPVAKVSEGSLYLVDAYVESVTSAIKIVEVDCDEETSGGCEGKEKHASEDVLRVDYCFQKGYPTHSPSKHDCRKTGPLGSNDKTEERTLYLPLESVPKEILANINERDKAFMGQKRVNFVQSVMGLKIERKIINKRIYEPSGCGDGEGGWGVCTALEEEPEPVSYREDVPHFLISVEYLTPEQI